MERFTELNEKGRPVVHLECWEDKYQVLLELVKKYDNPLGFCTFPIFTRTEMSGPIIDKLFHLENLEEKVEELKSFLKRSIACACSPGAYPYAKAYSQILEFLEGEHE